MNIEIIGVPLYYGSDIPGTELAFETFMDNDLSSILEKSGDSVVRIVEKTVAHHHHKMSAPSMKYLTPVWSVCKALELEVNSCLSRGNFPLVIGGDHSIGLGSVAGASLFSTVEDLTVIWVDAHTDINTDQTSPSHNIHGMPLAACLGLGSTLLFEAFDGGTPMLLPKNLFYIGTRSVDPGEAKVMRENRIFPFDMKTINAIGMDEAVTRLLSKVKTKKIHLSFDVDFMDSSYFKATGLPVAGGPSLDDTRLCLCRLLADKRVQSMDFVEYSPARDEDNSGLSICLDLLESAFAARSL